MTGADPDFADFFENVGIPLHIVGQDGTILHANRAELELLGYTTEEYVHRSINEFHADQHAIQDILQRLSRGEEVKRHPALLRAKDGTIRHVEVSSSGRFVDGEFKSTRCYTLDVTAAKKAEQQSAERERYWRSALDALPAAIYTTDAEGRITYFNEAAVHMAGRRPVLGNDEWCVTWRLFNVDGTLLPHDECPMAIALKENRPVSGCEAIAERPDGSRVLFQPFPTPLHDKSGKLIGAINLLLDITERRQLEADAARLASIVRSSSDAIVSKSLDGIITSWNAGAQKIFGYEASEIVGQSILRLIPPELREEETQILAKLRRGESIEHFDTVRVAKDGRRVEVSLSVSPVWDKSGKLIGAAKVARDITARRQAEETQNLLMGELNHRVKNTLATVQAIATQTLRNASTPADFASAFLGRVQALANAHSLLTQTNWIGAGLNDLIRGQVLIMGSDDQRISCSGPGVVLDPHHALHMALVLHELGTNARKHGALLSPRGRVAITWSVGRGSDQDLELEWRESDGPPVYAQPTRQGFGTRLIEQSMRAVEGGEAHMRLEAGGIVWNFKVPLASSLHVFTTSQVASSNPLTAVASTLASSRPKRVLVVEDEPLVAMDIAATLEEGGLYVVGPAPTVEQALSYIAREEFDAVFLDANLNGKSVDSIAAALTRRNIPFVFVTGYGPESLPKSFANVPTIGKPFERGHLLGRALQMVEAQGGGLRRIE